MERNPWPTEFIVNKCADTEKKYSWLKKIMNQLGIFELLTHYLILRNY